MLENESLWEVTTRCYQLFLKSNIDHSICGGIAVWLHGHQRNTTDVDIVIEPSDTERVLEVLTANGLSWNEQEREFRIATGIPVQFLVYGEIAGKGSEVRIPEPTGEFNVEEREGSTVVKLSRLVEMEIASGLGNLRRKHKDFADVVELIAIQKLDSSFVRSLYGSLRDTFEQLVRSAQTQE